MSVYFKTEKMPYINKSKSDFWLTPPHIKERFEGYFDPCPYPKPDFDGLQIEWKAQNFVNPPYSKLGLWCKKSYEESLQGREVVLLIPARTDTKYFHTYVLPYARIEFIKGRLKFVNPFEKKTNSAPFPSILCFYNS